MTNKPAWVRPAVVDVHLRKYEEDPDAAHYQDLSALGIDHPVPTLILKTTGWKSGEKRATPLNYGKVDGNFILVASKAGYVEHPFWYLNLKKDPNAEIQAGREHFRVRARDATASEHDRLWAAMVEVFPIYNDYASKTEGRVIPIVVLEPLE